MTRRIFSFKALLIGVVLIALVAGGGLVAFKWWPRNYGAFDLSSIEAIDTSEQHTLILLSNGQLWGVGNGQDRQLGISASNLLLAKKNSYTGYRYTDKPVEIMEDVVQAEAGLNFSLALKTDGTLWGFGYNVDQELGIDTGSDFRHKGIEPTKIMEGVTQIASGARHSMALKADGSLWGIGTNAYGQLGVSNLTFIGFLEAPKVMDGVQAVFCGLRNSFALQTDGSLWSMGRNIAGELGYAPEQENNHVPQKIADNAVMVAAYEDHTLLLMNDGEVMGMGSNSTGQLGLEESQVTEPTTVASDARSIAVGRAHSLILKSDGTLWGMGDNRAGQLGVAGVESISQIAELQENVKAVYAAGDHTLVLTNSGELLAWGSSDHGQIGVPGFFLAEK